MKHDEANVVIDNVLTEEEILQVVAAVEKSHGTDFVSVHCQTNNFIQLPQNIINKFTEYNEIIITIKWRKFSTFFTFPIFSKLFK